MSGSLIRSVFPLLALALSLASCGEKFERADLVFINAAEIETLDPAIMTDQVSMRIGDALFEGLCRTNAQGKPEPAVAERWDVSPDRRIYTFHLRRDSVWSNGDPVTAMDFVKSWERALRPATASDYAPQLYPLLRAKEYNEGKLTDFAQVGVKALDDHTLETTLENPIPYWIDLCAFLTLAPVNTTAVEKFGWTDPNHVVGNGAYTIERWLIDDHIRLRRNPRYWDRQNVRMEVVDVVPISDSNTALNYFVTGQADLMMDKGQVPPSLVPKLKQQPYFHTGPFLGTWFIRVNVTKPSLSNPLVRQALAMAVDKKRIVEKITQLGENPAYSLTPPGAGDNYQPPAGLEYNPARARELLAQAGFPNGRGFPSISYLHLPQPIERNIAVELQSMWRENLGITVNLTKQEQKIWLASMRELSYDLCRSSWVGDYNDANTFLEMFTTGNGNNRTGFASTAYDGFIAGASREADPVQRFKIFNDAERLLISEQTPIIPIYHYVGVQFRQPELQGVQANIVDMHPFRAMSWKNDQRPQR